MCFTLSFFVLLCGLVLDGFRGVVASELEAKAAATGWSKVNTGQYVGAIAFSYLCFVMFLVFSLCLVAFQSAVSEELGIAGMRGAGGAGGAGGGGPPASYAPSYAQMSAMPSAAAAGAPYAVPSDPFAKPAGPPRRSGPGDSAV